MKLKGKIHMVRWKKNNGSLGVKDIIVFNEVLLGEWRW